MQCGNMIGAFNVAIPELFHDLRHNTSLARDLYHALAQEKIKPEDTVVTFNYDLACERALHMAGLWEVSDGYGFDLGVEWIPSSKVRILKLHGSTNWLGILFGGNMGFSQASSVYDHRPAVFGKREFAFLGYAEDMRDPLARARTATTLPAETPARTRSRRRLGVPSASNGTPRATGSVASSQMETAGSNWEFPRRLSLSATACQSPMSELETLF